MGFLAWIVLGGIAGLLASLVVKNSGSGLLGNIVIGIVGAFIGGFVMSLFGSEGVTGFNVFSLFTAFVGAVILLLLVRSFRGRSHA